MNFNKPHRRRSGRLFVVLCILQIFGSIGFAGKLPQRSEFQRVMRDYLSTFKPEDFKLPPGEFSVNEEYLADPDNLFKTWLVLRENYGRFPNGLFDLSADTFTLEKIESPEGVRLRARKDLYPASLLWFTDWDYPGNPLYQSKAVRNRVLVFCIVDMLMLDAQQVRDTPDAKPVQRTDFLGGSLIWYAMAYAEMKNELPKNVREVYETMLNRFVDRLIQWRPAGGLGNMECMGLVAMAIVAQSAEDPALAEKAKSYAKMVTDKVVAPAGYVTDGGGTDISYNGLALYHLAWAARLSGWDFLEEATKRLLTFYRAMTFPDPDGTLWGPSHFSSRTSADAANDQWAFMQRQYGLALGWPEAAGYLVFQGQRAPRMPDEERMRASIAKELNSLNKVRKTGESKPRSSSPWGEEHFDARYNWAWKFYKQGEYAMLRKAETERPVWTQVPLLQKEHFDQNLADEIILERNPHYAALVHAGKIGRFQSSIYGLGGGTLSAFWTPKTGSVFLSRRRGYQHKNPDTLAEWRIWPVHALSGVNREGRMFSSARVRFPEVKISAENSRKVVICGEIADELSAPEQSLKAPITYERTFEFHDEALEYATKISGDGLSEAGELYEIFPIFLRDDAVQPNVQTEILFVVGGSEKAATPEAVENVEAVRVRRFGGVVEMRFDRPRTVRLSPEVWKDTYQSKVEQRNILIDLRNDPELRCRISEISADKPVS